MRGSRQLDGEMWWQPGKDTALSACGVQGRSMEEEPITRSYTVCRPKPETGSRRAGMGNIGWVSMLWGAFSGEHVVSSRNGQQNEKCICTPTADAEDFEEVRLQIITRCGTGCGGCGGCARPQRGGRARRGSYHAGGLGPGQQGRRRKESSRSVVCGDAQF